MNSTLHDSTPCPQTRGQSTSPGTATRAIDLRLSLVRGPARLPWRGDVVPSGEPLPASEVLAAARSVTGAGAFLIGGGDPFLRADLPSLLHELAAIRPERLGLCTAGTGLTDAALRQLRAAGVQRIVVPFHCARRDAHDWLVGRPGALKIALRAIRTSIDAGMPVEAEIVVTRPTMSQLAETVDVLTRSGVRTISLRRLTAVDVEPAEFIVLSPRLSLLTADLERAATIALQRRARLTIRDFPLCVAPRLRRLFARSDAEVWIASDGRVAPRVDHGSGCPNCPGAPVCAGAPADYVARFGWEELADPTPAVERVQETVAAQQTIRPAGTMVFAWRGPRRMRCDACADDAAPTNPESTRVVRARLVEAARFRPEVLRVVGAELLAHPNAAALLFDAVRLFPRVECAGEGSAIVKWTDVELRRLKDLQRIDVALYGPDAATHDAHCGIAGSFAATLRGVERLREKTSIPLGAYAVVHDARTIPRFVDAWSRGELPGVPRFRLAADGDLLDDVVECARSLPEGAARSALMAVVPRCLCSAAGITVADVAGDASTEREARPFAVASGRRVPHTPRGSDPFGAFMACGDDGTACTVTGCPGTAIGWQRNTRSERWMQDS